MKDTKEDHDGFEDHYSTPIECNSHPHSRGEEVLLTPPRIENSPESKDYKVFIKREGGVDTNQLLQAMGGLLKHTPNGTNTHVECKGSSSQKLSGMSLQAFLDSDI